jgi:hypothetical protein
MGKILKGLNLTQHEKAVLCASYHYSEQMRMLRSHDVTTWDHKKPWEAQFENLAALPSNRMVIGEIKDYSPVPLTVDEILAAVYVLQHEHSLCHVGPIPDKHPNVVFIESEDQHSNDPKVISLMPVKGENSPMPSADELKSMAAAMQEGDPRDGTCIDFPFLGLMDFSRIQFPPNPKG